MNGTTPPKETLGPASLHDAAFNALPLPATLIDAQGIIVDLNTAFIEHARRVTDSVVAKEDRIGRHIMDFAHLPENRRALDSVLQTVLGQGQETQQTGVNNRISKSRRYFYLHGIPIKDAAGQLTGALLLRDDITAAARTEQCRMAIAAVRDKVWGIQHSEDLDEVMIAIRDSLRDLGIPFQACGINLIVPKPQGQGVISCNMERNGTTIKRDRHPQGEANILAMWKNGQMAYRTDLSVEDPNSEIQLVEQFFQHPIRSIVDVPFETGTLAINSTLPQAFSPEDIEILLQMSKVLAEGLARVRDFQRLEQRSFDLEQEITARRKTERLLQLNLALQNIRTEILKMQTDADWPLVALQFYKNLHTLVPADHCVLFLIDLDEDRYTASSMAEANSEPVVYSAVPTPLKQALDAGKPLYMPTRKALAENGYTLDPSLGSLIDIPFQGGVIRLARTIEQGYEAKDLQTIVPFAQVMAEGYRRLEDLRQLAIQEQQLRQTQRLEVIGRLAGGVAHDFNNMLTAILGPSAHLLAQLPPDAPTRPDLELIYTAGQRAAQLTQQLLAFSRQQILRPRELELNAVLAQLIAVIPRMLGEDIDLKMDLSPDTGWVEIDPGQFEQVILNLAINARDALPQGGRFRFSSCALVLDNAFCAQHPDLVPGTYARLDISDTGHGMDEKTRLRAFEPFFTTKGLGQATGLGLSTVFGIIKQSKGHIWVESEPGQGTTFTILLPQVVRTPDAPVLQPVVSTEQRTGETILVVEDEPLVRSMIINTLATTNYQVLSAADGQEALALPALANIKLDLLLSDMVMPRMNGEKLATLLQKHHPDLKVLFISGYDPGPIEALVQNRPNMDFLAKPFAPTALHTAVRTLLDRTI